LLRGLLKAGIYRPSSGWRELALVAAGANALMAVVLIFALHELGDWVALGKVAQLWRLALLVAGGAAVYSSVCWLLGLRPRDLRARLG
jgi:putative peptidoglycan lipid II flippase